MASLNLKRNIVSALCNFFSLSSEVYLDEIDNNDVMSLCTKIFSASKYELLRVEQDELRVFEKDELMKWVAFVENLPVNALVELNGELIKKSVILGNGLSPTATDVIVFAAIHPHLIGFSDSDKEKLPHLLRWMTYIQDKVKFEESFERISLPPYEPPGPKFEAPMKKAGKEAKETASKEADVKAGKNNDKKKSTEEIQAPVDKKKPNKEDAKDNKKKSDKEADSKDNKKNPVKEADAKDNEVSVTLLKIQVGLVCKASKHPSADSLLVEEIDVGEGKHRQVVSGLAKYITPEQMTNRYVLLVTNLKPAKLRDVMSEGMVLCASNQDHTVVEPVIVPEGAKIGEFVTFSGHEGKPEDVLNPKKKQLEKITPHLFTDANGIATFKDVPFMTSAGPCKSSIPNASIK